MDSVQKNIQDGAKVYPGATEDASKTMVVIECAAAAPLLPQTPFNAKILPKIFTRLQCSPRERSQLSQDIIRLCPVEIETELTKMIVDRGMSPHVIAALVLVDSDESAQALMELDKNVTPESAATLEATKIFSLLVHMAEMWRPKDAAKAELILFNAAKILNAMPEERAVEIITQLPVAPEINCSAALVSHLPPERAAVLLARVVPGKIYTTLQTGVPGPRIEQILKKLDEAAPQVAEQVSGIVERNAKEDL